MTLFRWSFVRAGSQLIRPVFASAITILLAGPAAAWQPPPKLIGPESAAQPAASETLPSPASNSGIYSAKDRPSTLLGDKFIPIDLPSAVRLAGLQNPDLFLARQRVVEAAAIRQLAAAQLLPSLNFGTNFDAHSGPLQQSNGNILKVSRSALYAGAGANAIAAGTVNIPGVVWNLNVSNAIYGLLVARQVVNERQFANLQTNNEILQDVAVAYYELLRAEGLHAVMLRMRGETAEVADITAKYASTGVGREADAERAATELAQREIDVLEIEGQVLVASANLCRLLNLDPSLRLHVTDGWVVPTPIVPDPITLSELVAMAMLQRPDLAERRAAIQEAFLSLQSARLLPFSPNTLVGFSAGTFGGGSNLVASGTPPAPTTPGPRFGNFAGRNDFDVVVFWTLQNLGYGNKALIDAARARLRQSDYQELIVLNRARADVATAYARAHARYAQIGTNERAVRAGRTGFQQDFLRTRNREGLPIETLDNLRLWNRASIEYLNSIVDFNEAQIQLYIALGQPRADMLARPASPEAVPAGKPESGPAAPAGDLPDRRANVQPMQVRKVNKPLVSASSK
jgi:outer membrane protein TolC